MNFIRVAIDHVVVRKHDMRGMVIWDFWDPGEAL